MRGVWLMATVFTRRFFTGNVLLRTAKHHRIHWHSRIEACLTRASAAPCGGYLVLTFMPSRLRFHELIASGALKCGPASVQPSLTPEECGRRVTGSYSISLESIDWISSVAFPSQHTCVTRGALLLSARTKRVTAFWIYR